MPLKTKYAFICGSGHSGSTLLSLLLEAHPEIHSLGEVTRLPEHIDSHGSCSCTQEIKECEFWQEVQNRIVKEYNIDILEAPHQFPLSLVWNRTRFTHYQRLLVALLGSSSLTHFDMRFGTESPSARRVAQNLFYLYDTIREMTETEVVLDASKSPVLMKWLWLYRPEHFKVIYLVRDGRGVMASHMRKGRSPESSARRWLKGNQQATWFLKTMPEDSWMQVKYEDLCLDPSSVLRQITTFLDLDYSNEMLAFREQVSHSVGGNRMRFKSGQEIVNRESWRQRLTSDDLALFEKIAGNWNRHFGYME